MTVAELIDRLKQFEPHLEVRLNSHENGYGKMIYSLQNGQKFTGINREKCEPIVNLITG